MSGWRFSTAAFVAWSVIMLIAFGSQVVHVVTVCSEYREGLAAVICQNLATDKLVSDALFLGFVWLVGSLAIGAVRVVRR